MKDDEWVDAIESKKNGCCEHKETRNVFEKGIWMEWCKKCGSILQEVGYDPDATYRNESLKQREQRKGYEGKMEFDLG